jgi:fibronectin type 3 domain-containing protein
VDSVYYSNEYIDTDLSADTIYYYRIAAVNNGIESNRSNTVWGKTPALPIPIVPIATSAKSVSSRSATVTWSYSPSDFSHFIVYRSIGSSDASESFDYIKEVYSNSFTDTELSPNTRYNYRISVVNNNYQESPQSNTVSVTTPPDTPTNVTATPTTNSISVTWDPVEGATGYIVYTFTAGPFHVNTNQFTRNYSPPIVGDYFTVSAFNSVTNLESAVSYQVYARLVGY